MKINLHLGAHKTATTHLQMMLYNANDLLREHKIKLSIPQHMRGRWIPTFYQYMETQDPSLVKDLTPEKNTDLWIISEENLSGISYHLQIKESIYPYLRERMTAFKKLFNYCDIKIFFSIRSYEQYYRSAYLEVVRNRGYLPFESFYDQYRFKKNSWFNVIENLVDVFGQESIYLWRYEDLHKLLPSILQKLTGLCDVSTIIESYGEKTTRPSISTTALQVISEQSDEGRKNIEKSVVETIIKKYPVGDKHPPFMPFQPNEIDALKTKYRTDIRAIKSKFSLINFVE